MAGQLEEIRKWARENGYEVADKGRISREVKIAFANKRKA
ncbi:Lsr2 family DNA-binding protein [Microbacterium oxydans]